MSFGRRLGGSRLALFRRVPPATYGGGYTDQLIDLRRWRRDVRPQVLRAAVRKTRLIRWSPRLFALLIEELHVDDSLEALIGDLRSLPQRRYHEAIATALLLRHSWRPDDLQYVLKRLGLSPKRPHSRVRAR